MSPLETGVLALSLGVAAVLAFLAARGWRQWALRRGVVDSPGEDRRLHAEPTPRGGGIGIALVLLVAAPALGELAIPFALGLLLTAAIGLRDDLAPMPAWAKALGQLAGALPLAQALPVLIAGGEGWPAFLVALGFILLLVNAWNFIDGSHGLAASQALLAGLAAAVLAGAGTPGAWLGLVLAAACLGFLPMNLPVARVFLGDVGSHALGYAVAATLLLVFDGRAPGPVLALVAPAAVLVDVGVTLASRALRLQPLWRAHREHLYQRAIAHGHGHLAVCLGYAAWSGAGLGLVAYFSDDAARAPFAVLAWYLATLALRIGLGRAWPRVARKAG